MTVCLETLLCWSWTSKTGNISSAAGTSCVLACSLLMWFERNRTKYKDRHCYLCWLNKTEFKVHSYGWPKRGLLRNSIKLIIMSVCLESHTCLAWKSPFLSQLGIGMVKRSSCVRVLDANLSNALCSSARHGACGRVFDLMFIHTRRVPDVQSMCETFAMVKKTALLQGR